jgi:hypothetical protein
LKIKFFLRHYFGFSCRILKRSILVSGWSPPWE